MTTLTTYAGGQTVAGGRLKSTRTAPAAHPRWDIPNAEATDQYGFSALPGGDRNRNGYFNYIGCYGFWWSATRYAPVQDAWYRYMCCNDGKVYRYYIIHQESGFSVRCLRDN
ncbi:MAG: FISUMP domain-containing protein [Bacteroidales bacterium]|nr:FISUMP domain-containing protein [Bacteroidales bacterium]